LTKYSNKCVPIPPAAEVIKIFICERYLYYVELYLIGIFKGRIYYLIAKYEVSPDGP
jgi:hypothetical protein